MVFMALSPEVVMPRLVRNCALGRGIQYSREREINRCAAAYWIIRFRG